MPAAPGGPVPAVVTISGTGAQDRDSYAPIAEGWRPFREFADTLGRRGIAVLRLDDRGTGGSTGDQGTATERTGGRTPGLHLPGSARTRRSQRIVWCCSGTPRERGSR